MDADEVARSLNPHAGEPFGRLRCGECGTYSDFRATGWRAYRAGFADVEDTPELVFFCPGCAEREFE